MGSATFYGELMGLFSSRAARAESQQPLEDASYVVLDTELTGLDVRRDSIVSIGAVRMAGGRILMGETFYRLVKPETELRSESVVVHQITPSEVDDMPGVEAALSEVTYFIGDAVVVGHFISLDMAFLNRGMKRHYGRTIQNQVIDTLSVHDWLRGEEKGFRRYFTEDGENKDLFTLARKYKVEVNGAHNALKDAFITAQVFQRLLRQLPHHGVRTLGDLLRVGRP